jgi:hypothetical protein
MKSLFSRWSLLLGVLFSWITVLLHDRQSQAISTSVPLLIAQRLLGGASEIPGMPTRILPNLLPDNLPIALPMPPRSHLLGTVLKFNDAFIYAESELTAQQIQEFYATFFAKAGWQATLKESSKTLVPEALKNTSECITYRQKGQLYEINLSILALPANSQQKQVFSLDVNSYHDADELAVDDFDWEAWHQSFQEAVDNQFTDWLSFARRQTSRNIKLPPAQSIPQTLMLGFGNSGGHNWSQEVSALSILSAAAILVHIDRQFQADGWTATALEHTALTAIQRWQQRDQKGKLWEFVVAMIEANDLSHDLLLFLGSSAKAEAVISKTNRYLGRIEIQELDDTTIKPPANYQPPQTISPRFAQLLLGNYQREQVPIQLENIAMPPQTRVVASMKDGLFSPLLEGTSDSVTVVLDVPLSPQQTQDFYDRMLASQGWKPDIIAHRFDDLPYGFPSMPIWEDFYRANNQSIQLLIRPTSQLNQSDVRIVWSKQDPITVKERPIEWIDKHLIESIDNLKKSKTLSQSAAEAVDTKYKLPVFPLMQFVLPESIVNISIGSSSSNEDNFSQTVTLETQLNLKALAKVFDMQLTHGGWHQTLTEASKTMLLDRWQLQDKQGKTWQTNLIYMQLTSEKYHVSLRCDRLVAINRPS